MKKSFNHLHVRLRSKTKRLSKNDKSSTAELILELSPQNASELKAYFGFRSNEEIVAAFICQLDKIFGKMYLTKNYICFWALDLGDKIIIPLTEIVSIKNTVSLLFPSTF